MATPYLHSGESIVLTTHRVSVDAVPYDIMLTTERLFLVDNRNPRFDPRVILLATILSVQGGKTPDADPAITLLLLPDDSGIARPPVNLVFTQNPGEKRRGERDDWMRSLIQLSISQRESAAVPETPSVPESPGVTGLRPATRHGLAPERVRPLSNIAEHGKGPAPVAVIPEDVDRDGRIPATVAAAMAHRAERPLPQERPAGATPPAGGTPPTAPAPHTRIIMPQIIEEMLPEKKAPAQEETQGQEAPASYDPEVLFRAIPTAARSMTITEERSPPAPPTDSPGEDEADLPGTGEFMAREIPDIIRALRTGPPPPEPEDSAAEFPEEIPSVAVPENVSPPAENPIPEQSPAPIVPEPVPESPLPQVPDAVTPQVSPTVPEPEQITGREPAVAGPPPIRHPLPPAHEIRPFRATLMYALIALFVIALVAAGALLLLPGPQETNATATPVPTLIPVTTVPPVTVQPATPHHTAIVTATTRPVTPAPAPVSSAVPSDGVWVRVSSTTEYSGTLGNAGYMRTVSGTGDNLYKILWNDKTVQVSVQKTDNSGSVLTATVYRNGTPIVSRSVTSPMGTVDILIDPVTARAPGLTGDDMIFGNATTPAVPGNS